MNRKLVLGLWEAGCVAWVCVLGSILHFAFELSEYWRPMALLAAVNESAWEHTKMYFWPGLLYALIQYTYTRSIANNFWLGKALALATTPVAIFVSYYSYMGYITSIGGKASLPTMLTIMILGISLGQFISFRILSAKPLALQLRRCALPVYVVLTGMFSSFTYFPPKIFLFENFYCYRYTGEFGILGDYSQYRVFFRAGEQSGAGVNYCAKVPANADAPSDLVKQSS